MNESALTCPRCAALLPPDSPHGLCAACLLSAAVSLDADDPPPPPAPAPDLDLLRRAFPQLEILAPLGAGGMGRVYRVRQPHLDRVAALKILPQELARDPAWVERFQREARALARLNHPHIVQVFDVGQASTGADDPPLCWLLMEFVDGVTLRQVQRTGGLSACEALAIVPRLCDAIHYAHEKGVLHRDIKPENILLDSTGCVKVADFGLAKLGGTGTGAAPSLTLTGARLGTAAYMAPEQIETPGDVDHRADIYSLGVVFYELLTGGLPLGRFPAPSEKSGTDPRLDQIVFRTLEKERDRRYQAAGDMKTAIEGVAATAAPPIPQPPPGTPLKREPRKIEKRVPSAAGPDSLTNASSENEKRSTGSHGPVPPGRAWVLARITERRGCTWFMMRLSALISSFLLACIPLGVWCGLCAQPDVLIDWPQGWIWLTLLAGVLAAYGLRPLWHVHPDAPRRWKLATGLGIVGLLVWTFAARVASDGGSVWPSVGHKVTMNITSPEPPLGTVSVPMDVRIQQQIKARAGTDASKVQVSVERESSGLLRTVVEAAGHSPAAVRRLFEDVYLDLRERAATETEIQMKNMWITANGKSRGIDWDTAYLTLSGLLLAGAFFTACASAAVRWKILPAGCALVSGLVLVFAPDRPVFFNRPVCDVLSPALGGSPAAFLEWAAQNPDYRKGIASLDGPETTAQTLAEAKRLVELMSKAATPDEAVVWNYLQAWIRRDHQARLSLLSPGFIGRHQKLSGTLRLIGITHGPDSAAGFAPGIERDSGVPETPDAMKEGRAEHKVSVLFGLETAGESFNGQFVSMKPGTLHFTLENTGGQWLISEIRADRE